MKKADRFRTASAMVWGGISHHGKMDIVFINARGRGAAGREGQQRQQGLTSRRYVEEILRPVVVSYFRANPGMVLQQDNARAHTACQQLPVLP